MLEIGTSGLMSGEGRRSAVAPRPSSTLPNSSSSSRTKTHLSAVTNYFRENSHREGNARQSSILGMDMSGAQDEVAKYLKKPYERQKSADSLAER